jgi:hypothetical protein
MAMSTDEHIYEPRHEELLRRHAYPGRWSGHDASSTTAFPTSRKTGRYFLKLLSSL